MIVSLTFENFDEIFSYVTEKQAIAKEFYEQQFMFLDKRKS